MHYAYKLTAGDKPHHVYGLYHTKECAQQAAQLRHERTRIVRVRVRTLDSCND